MKVLIVDDGKINLRLDQELMEDWGYEYDVAVNGAEAVIKARNNAESYDICLMDIEMPVMDGLEAAKVIRDTVRYFPIIGTSANHDYKHDCIAVGMDEFLGTPYDFDILYQKIIQFTVKSLKLIYHDEAFSVGEERPMNQNELNELRRLKKKGLTKLKLIGTDYSFIVHKNIQNKISYDLVGQGKELSEFIDRSEEEPGRCHLYKANLHVTKDLFIPDELENAIEAENEVVLNLDKCFDKKISEQD